MVLLSTIMSSLVSRKVSSGSTVRCSSESTVRSSSSASESRSAGEVVSGCGLRSERSTSVVGSGQERGSSSGASVAWRGNVGVAQMSSKDAVDRQSEAHELREEGLELLLNKITNKSLVGFLSINPHKFHGGSCFVVCSNPKEVCGRCGLLELSNATDASSEIEFWFYTRCTRI